MNVDRELGYIAPTMTRYGQQQLPYPKWCNESTIHIYSVLRLFICAAGIVIAVSSSNSEWNNNVVHAAATPTTTISNGGNIRQQSSEYDKLLNTYEFVDDDEVDVEETPTVVGMEPTKPQPSRQQRVPWIRFKDSNNQRHLQLEFSGRICTQIIGGDDSIAMTRFDEPRHQQNNNKVPLVNMIVDSALNRNWYPPWMIPKSIFLTTHYDFTKCWYGVRQLDVTAQFRAGQRRQLPSDGTTTNDNYLVRRIIRNICPTWIDIAKEYPIGSSISSSQRSLDTTTTTSTSNTIIGCRWPSVFVRELRSSSQDFVALEFRKDDTPWCMSKVFHIASVKIPLHQRLHLECHFVNQDSLPHQTMNIQRRQQQQIDSVVNDDDDDDWWIPNVRIDALGLMESKNYVKPFDKHNVGLTLSLRRRLNWSALGWLGGGDNTADNIDSEQTRIQLRLQHQNRQQTASSLLEMTSQMARPFETASVLLRHDVAIR